MGEPVQHGGLDRVRADVATVMREASGVREPLARVCEACTELLPIDGASVSVMSGTTHRETLYASDENIQVVESLQFTLGEGPCFDAFTHHRPVLIADLAADSAPAWPVFAAEISEQPIGAIFAFPLQSGAITIGAMDLYRREPGPLPPDELATALQLVDLATLTLLGMEQDRPEERLLDDLPANREVVHQAAGMLIAEHRIQPEHALARLRGYAFANGRSVETVAGDLTNRRLHPAEIEQ